MHTRTDWTIVLAVASLMVVASLSVGCQQNTQTSGPPAGHQHTHDHPETFPAAVAEIKKLRDSIRTTFESGNPKDADDELHEIGHLLEHLPEIAAQADLPEEAQKKINMASDDLFNAFAELDVFHGGNVEEVAYGDVSETIESNIKTLESFAGETHAEGEHETDAQHEGEHQQEDATPDNSSE